MSKFVRGGEGAREVVMYFSTLALPVELWQKNWKIPVDTGEIFDGLAEGWVRWGEVSAVRDVYRVVFVEGTRRGCVSRATEKYVDLLRSERLRLF